MRPEYRPFAALCLIAACATARAPDRTPGDRPSLITEAERTGFARTGRHAEAVRLCDGFAAVHPGRARCERFGVTPEGRELVALVTSDDGVLTAEAAAQAQRPVLLIQGAIHAGEIEGKDAGFIALREAMSGTAARGALRAVTVVFVPIYNADGHERFGPNPRPNQRGPEEIGFRTTARNLNLNRDYMKVDAPETAAMLSLFRRWDPVVYVDLHTTDGAKFEHDVAVLLSPSAPGGGALGDASRALSAALQARLTALGHLPLAFYPTFVVEDDPSSGFAQGEMEPRFSQAYAGQRNRLGVLVETHSWHTYRQRVDATRDLLVALLERAIADAKGWRDAADAADAADTALAGRAVVLQHKAAAAVRTIAFRGYAYERRPSPVSGAPWITYDETRPQIWNVPLRDQLEPHIQVSAPRGGYLIPTAFAEVVASKLDAHGIHYERTAEAVVDAEIEAFRADTVALQPPFEGRTRAAVQGAWRAERLSIPRGSLWVPIAQPRARLLLHLMEPTGPDSLTTWGFFNTVFEQKEIAEAYVIEEFARDLLARDPAVRREFDQRLASDPAFAASAEQRLSFFRRRHPTWDKRYMLLPVYRAAERPHGAGAAPPRAAAR